MILRTELRRSSALAAGGLVVALGVAGLYVATTNQSELWDTQWTMLATFQRIMLIVLWPLALGAGAWQARRDRRSRTEELLGTTSRPTWQRVLPTSAAMAICLAVGYLVMLAAGALRVAGNTTYFHAGWIPIALVGALSLVAAGWLGMGIGRLIPSIYTPPLLAVTGFLAVIAPVQLSKGGPGHQLDLLTPGFVGPAEEFTTVTASVNAAQAVWFTALALAGLVLFMVARRAAGAAVLPAALGLAVAVQLLNGAPASGFQTDPGAVAEVCTDDSAPEVCVLKVHEHDLSTVVGPARQALTLLAKLPDAPTSVHEVAADRAGPQPMAQVWLSSENHQPKGGWLGDAQDGLLMRVLAGAGTLPCNDDDQYSYRTRSLVAGWFSGEEPARTPGNADWDAETARQWQALQALPADEQVRRIAAARQAGLTCGDQTAALALGGDR